MIRAPQGELKTFNSVALSTAVRCREATMGIITEINEYRGVITCSEL